jgi:hypothetical protein
MSYEVIAKLVAEPGVLLWGFGFSVGLLDEHRRELTAAGYARSEIKGDYVSFGPALENWPAVHALRIFTPQRQEIDIPLSLSLCRSSLA